MNFTKEEREYLESLRINWLDRAEENISELEGNLGPIIVRMLAEKMKIAEGSEEFDVLWDKVIGKAFKYKVVVELDLNNLDIGELK